MTTDLFCPLPWITTSIRNDGIMRLCCHSNQGPNRGELNWDVDDIQGSRNSPMMKETRLKFLSNEWPADCIRCKKESESGIRTRFQYESEIWDHHINKLEAKRVTESDGTIDTNSIPLIYYDLRFGNLCNLKCRYCSPLSSSAIGEVKGDYHWFERDVFWEHLRENMNNIDLFHIEGGEPLLIKQHYDFMEECIRLDKAKDIRIEYTTSLNKVPEKVWDMWAQFKEVRIGVSMDAIGSEFDYIRYPSKFDKITKSLRRLDTAPGNIVIWLACTVTSLGIWYLPELFKWKIRQQFKRVNKYDNRPYCSDHPLHKPLSFNIKSLPMTVKARVTDHLLASIPGIDETADRYERVPKMRDAYKKVARNVLFSYINFMNSEDFSASHYPVFCNYNKKLDEERNQSMKEMMPEWYEVLKEEE